MENFGSLLFVNREEEDGSRHTTTLGMVKDQSRDTISNASELVNGLHNRLIEDEQRGPEDRVVMKADTENEVINTIEMNQELHALSITLKQQSLSVEKELQAAVLTQIKNLNFEPL